MATAAHKIQIGDTTASIVLADNYDNSESNIGTSLGISKLGDNDSLPKGTLPIDLSSGLNKGILARLVVRYKPTTGKAKTGRIICPTDKAYTAVTDLIGKNYRGGKIQSVSVPQRVRYT